MNGKEPLELLDASGLDDFSCDLPGGITVIMPCIDRDKGMETARMLLGRAGIECRVLVVYDSLRQGFIKTLNQTAARVNAKYIVYTAQDAWPGRGWLECAWDTLEKTKKGLLAFNDGKWKGQIASFGMVRTKWVSELYGGDIFFPGYKSHAADNELTVIARARAMHVYNPECTLVEIDPGKDHRSSSLRDKALFQARFQRGFDGLAPMGKLRKMAREYKVDFPPHGKNSLERRPARSALNRGVSILVTVPREQGNLERLLASFSRVNTHRPFEFIVLDRSGSAAARRAASGYGSGGFIRYIDFSPFLQLPDASRVFSSLIFDYGAKKARYPFIFLLESDADYDSDVLPPALAEMERKPTLEFLKTALGAKESTIYRKAGLERVKALSRRNAVKRGRIEVPVVTEHNLKVKRTPSVDVIVCVHNALEEVRQCLGSILAKTSYPYRLILVNDGSGEETGAYLKRVSCSRPGTVLVENEKALGYTRAANQGLRASCADYSMLLNSDTIVTSRWLERIVECGESDPCIGIIGPLSNAASYQSVPRLRDEKGDWAVNLLPGDMDPDHMASALYGISNKEFPAVPFLNGFCYAIKKEVIKTVGYLDEQVFPVGYGEENDYSIRARNAGYLLAVADHAYVYHHKSRSFNHGNRRKFASEGRRSLESKYRADVIRGDIKKWESIDAIDRIRERLEDASFAGLPAEAPGTTARPGVLWLLNDAGGGGGALSVVQEANCLREMGWNSRVAVNEVFREKVLYNYAHFPKEIFVFYKDNEELNVIAASYNIVVGTYFETIRTLENIYLLHPNIIPAYYIQDYEPWIIDRNSKKFRSKCTEAFISYERINSILAFAKTNWIKHTVEKYHPSLSVHKVTPGLDTRVFEPDTRSIGKNADCPVRITAMVRPVTERRSPRLTMEILKRIKTRNGDRVIVEIFGCSNNDSGFLSLPRDFEFRNRGVLTAPQVAELFAESDIFVDASVYQAFGRTGLEAMARGCAAVMPVRGGAHEYCEHEINCLLTDTSDPAAVEQSVQRLIDERRLRIALAEKGVVTASRYSVGSAALSEALVFEEAYRKRLSVGRENVVLGRKILESFFENMLPGLNRENEAGAAGYPAWRSSCRRRRPRVLVGTLLSGENEINACRDSIKNQTYKDIQHEIIEGLGKKQAVNALFEMFIHGDCDLLIKLDADMVVPDRDFVSRVVDIFRYSDDLILLQMAVSDYYSGGPMQGVNAYSKALQWRKQDQHDLFTDKTGVPAENRLVVWTKFVDSVIHAPQASNFHSFHFGVHRGLKAVKALEEPNGTSRAEEQVRYLADTWRHYLVRREKNLLMACLGAERAFREAYAVKHLDYTDGSLLEEFRELEGRPADELERELCSLRNESLPNPALENLRVRHFGKDAPRRVSSILFLVPHTKRFGGVNRFFELSSCVQKLGYTCTVAVPDPQMAPYMMEGRADREDYPEVEVVSFSEAVENTWDAAVCGDFSHGVMLLLPLVRCGLSVVYLLNGWQQRSYNIRQTKLIDADVVIANSSYAAKHYPDLAPDVIPGGINLDVFKPGCGRKGDGDHVKVFIPPGSNKARKRLVDAVEACGILQDKGYRIETHALVGSYIDVKTRFPFIQHARLNRHQVAELIGSCDIALCPEEDAGWNNPAAEALGCGLPLVCTEAGTTDFAVNGETAIVAEPRNPEKLARAVEELILDPKMAGQLAEAGNKKIQEFSWDNVARAFVSVLNRARVDYSARKKRNEKCISKIKDALRLAG